MRVLAAVVLAGGAVAMFLTDKVTPLACVWTVALPLMAWAIYALPRSGVVRFYDDRIVFEKLSHAPYEMTVPWSEVEAFEDGSTDYVTLVRKGATDANVPTPAEEIRTRVLALLIEKNVPRR
jgi:hypothetical protein